VLCFSCIWMDENFLWMICTMRSISLGVMGRVRDCSRRRFITCVVNSLHACNKTTDMYRTVFISRLNLLHRHTHKHTRAHTHTHTLLTGTLERKEGKGERNKAEIFIENIPLCFCVKFLDLTTSKSGSTESIWNLNSKPLCNQSSINMSVKNIC
jgi:hypothetical protein